MQIKKNIRLGKINFFIFLYIFIQINHPVFSEDHNNLEGNFVEIKILDKVSSKNELLKIKIGKSVKFKDISIKATTTDQLGFIGAEKGIAVYAVCLAELLDNG